MKKAIGTIAWATSILGMLGAVACGAGTPDAAHPSSGGGDQASAGATLYTAQCASCHGGGGEGSAQVPAVVGKSALPLDAHAPSKGRKSKFRTVADVFTFVQANMPPDNPGSLRDDQYWAILAFDLKANGVDLGGKTLDATTAPSFVLHP